MKPKLPRKLARTPRINLNKYWNLFEEMMTNDNSGNSSRQEQSAEQNSRLFEDLDMNNEINENISNELKENDENLVRNNEENNRLNQQQQRCTCNLCLISDMRNISMTDSSEDVTEL